MAISSLSIAQAQLKKKVTAICMLDLRNIFMFMIVFESAKIVMICSLNLDLSSFFDELFLFRPLTTNITFF
jgi:hypothetical protein